jgi:hypothetical protein
MDPVELVVVVPVFLGKLAIYTGWCALGYSAIVRTRRKGGADLAPAFLYGLIRTVLGFAIVGGMEHPRIPSRDQKIWDSGFWAQLAGLHLAEWLVLLLLLYAGRRLFSKPDDLRTRMHPAAWVAGGVALSFATDVTLVPIFGSIALLGAAMH